MPLAARSEVATRACGFPARVVTGYQGGELNPVDGTLAVRQSDAHAWAEVWVAGHGWLRVGLGILLYGFAAAVHYLVIEFVRAKNAEQRELESLLTAQEAELRMLRTQIDPHFLFNSLNSISALTSQDPKAARRMTSRARASMPT